MRTHARLDGRFATLALTVGLACATQAADRAEITFADGRIFPESLTSTRDGTLYFGSLGQDSVYRATPRSAKADTWIRPKTNGLQTVLGVFADESAGTLWVCASAAGGRDGAPVERSDSACERIDETVQFRVREGTIDVPVAFGCVPVEIISAENDFERATTADQVRETFCAATTRMQSHCDFRLPKAHILARCEAHVAREDELAARAAHASADFRNTHDRRLSDTHERIQKYWKTGRADAGHDIAQLAG